MAIFNTLRANLCFCELFTGLLHISYNVIMAAASVAEVVAITFEKAVFVSVFSQLVLTIFKIGCVKILPNLNIIFAWVGYISKF